MKSPSFKKYALLSLAAHAVLVLILLLLDRAFPEKPHNNNDVTIELLSPEDLKKQAEEHKPEEMPAQQIVEQDDTHNDEPANPKAKYLSAHNQTVQKETVAATHGEFQNKKTTVTGNAGQRGDGHPLQQAVKATPQAQQEALSKDLFGGFDSEAALQEQIKLHQAQEAGLGQGSQNDHNDGRGADVSQTTDYLKDVDQGVETLVNAREFKYYSYYNRIRRQLAQHWEGRVREKLTKMFKEGRSPASTGEDRITKLMITLNDQGTLVRVQVMSDSGIHDLDDAAVEAFRAAAPFPNPPKGIVDSDGTVKIRWDFVLES